VVRDERGWSHVLLVSSATHPDGRRRWLVLGYGAEARLVDQERLRPVPLDFRPRPGSRVWVAWRGQMVPATTRSVDRSGLVHVVRPSLGGGMVVGCGMLMPPAP